MSTVWHVVDDMVVTPALQVSEASAHTGLLPDGTAWVCVHIHALVLKVEQGGGTLPDGTQSPHSQLHRMRACSRGQLGPAECWTVAVGAAFTLLCRRVLCCAVLCRSLWRKVVSAETRQHSMQPGRLASQGTPAIDCFLTASS